MVLLFKPYTVIISKMYINVLNVKNFIFDSKNFILALEWQEICNYSLTSRNKQTATTMTTKLLSEELVKTRINVKHCMACLMLLLTTIKIM